MFRAPAAPIVLKLPQGHKDSKYVHGFEIGQRESGFYSERTDRITESQGDRVTEPSSSVLVYRYVSININSVRFYHT